MDVKNLYSQFCPVSMASEIFCTRWTPLVVRELLCGSVRFNDIRKGVPKMSPSLLSKRLRELELAGVVRTVTSLRGSYEYHLTRAGEELRPLVMGIGKLLRDWWLVVEPEETDLCLTDPGFDVDIVVIADLRAITSIWMGLSRLGDEIESGAVTIDATPALEARLKDWLKLSVFASQPRMVD